MRSRLCLAFLGLLVASGVVACSDAAAPETQVLEAGPATVGAVPPAPVQGRMQHAAVWTGVEMLVWGGVGQPVEGSPRELGDGAAYDPVTSTWRVLAPSPLSPRVGMAAVWAGDLWFVWGGSAPYSSSSGVRGDGALYDPATDSWTILPEAPLDPRTGARAVWTGTEILLFGGVAGHSSEQHRGNGAAYNPSAGTWRPIATAPLPDF